MSYTATVQYDLWKNVLSRLEIRWDHDLTGGDPIKFYGANRPILVAVLPISMVSAATQGSTWSIPGCSRPTSSTSSNLI